MMMVKADHDSEAGMMPSAKLVAAMGKFNDEMIAAGVMLAGEGLHPSSKGARVSFSGGTRVVTDGPFPETKELVAGYWVIEVASKEEAIQWASRVPFERGEVELRQIFEASDFPPEILPPEEAAKEQAWRDEQQRRKR
jgi:hypothetical protein